MSYMHLLAADRELPDRDCRTERSVELRSNRAGPDSEPFIVHGDMGFAIEKCCWSHHGMTPDGRPNDMEHVRTKPFLYNIELIKYDEQTFLDLKRYLTDVLSPGECVELWRVCLGGPFYDEGPEYLYGELNNFSKDIFDLLFSDCEVCIDIRA